MRNTRWCHVILGHKNDKFEDGSSQDDNLKEASPPKRSRCSNDNGGCGEKICVEVDGGTVLCVTNDCSVNNGNCEDNLCVDTWMLSNISIECVTKDGEIAIDIDRKLENLQGCFREVNKQSSTNVKSIGGCQAYCGTKYYTIKFPHSTESNEKDEESDKLSDDPDGVCVCADEINRRVELKKCSVSCSDGTLCGGPDHFSVYAKPSKGFSLIGCFKFVSEETLVRRDAPSDNVEFFSSKCHEQCLDGNYFFLITSWTDEDPECFCASSLKVNGQLEPGQCEMKKREVYLVREDQQILQINSNGKDILHALFFDSVNMRLDYTDNFKTAHYCLNDKNERFSKECKQWKCTPGWTGNLCDIRDCNVQNGMCHKDTKCLTDTIGERSVSYCGCDSDLELTNKTLCLESRLVAEVAGVGSTVMIIVIVGSAVGGILLGSGTAFTIWKVRKSVMEKEEEEEEGEEEGGEEALLNESCKQMGLAKLSAS
ncbi:hypothetical protein HELRODRAFT_177810 [Helobdella robusta]|uniref:Uncharacterized protein n=1 Tax=Helobdella robusta TaxID=6412 RepID=T1FCA8_HELRO|nr:hypothetical protein HELRODRAFT_177810 [Helobdella robusta]ESN97748.1 hypothetical protein HELRODRAFT_177810 [Helobdella robusta]